MAEYVAEVNNEINVGNSMNYSNSQLMKCFSRLVDIQEDLGKILDVLKERDFKPTIKDLAKEYQGLK